MAKILIIGGHGKVALRLSELLAQDGDEVTAVIRNPDHAHEVQRTGATPVVEDVTALESQAFADLLRGHDAVVWSAGAGGGDPERTRAVDRDAAIRSMDAAAAAGVRRYVMVSYMGAGQDHGVPEDHAFYPYAQAKADADDHLRASELDWTILGPGALTLEEPTGRIRLGRAQDAEQRQTSRGNVALVAREALRHPGSTTGVFVEFADGETPIDRALGELA